MKRFTPKKNTALLFACAIFTIAGCHRNQATQATQNTAAQSSTNPQSQDAAQTPAAPNTAAASGSNAPQPASSVSAAPNATTPSASVPQPAASTQQAQAYAPAPGTQQGAQQANAAPQPAPIVVPQGTHLRMRINQHISVKTAHAGDRFDGTIVEPVAVNGTEVIPAGSLAQGEVIEAHRRGRFKGRSVLDLTLVGLDVNGKHYRLDTSNVVRTKKGKGKRTAAFIGGGTGLGMLIGGVASGGTGLLIGGLSGAGAGTLGAAFTGNRDIDLPAETVLSFRLAQPVQLQ